MRDRAFALRAEEELRDANAAGEARAGLAIAAASTDPERERIQRGEDRARGERLQRHIERISIPEDRYTPASEDPSVWRALSMRRVTHGPRRVRRASRRPRRARRDAAVARGSPGNDPPPAEPPGEPGDASGAIVMVPNKGPPRRAADLGTRILAAIDADVNRRVDERLAALQADGLYSTEALPAGISRRVFHEICQSGVVVGGEKDGRTWSRARAAWHAARRSGPVARLCRLQDGRTDEELADLAMVSTQVSDIRPSSRNSLRRSEDVVELHVERRPHESPCAAMICPTSTGSFARARKLLFDTRRPDEETMDSTIDSKIKPGATRDVPGDVDEAWLGKMTPEDFERWHNDCSRKHEQVARGEISLNAYLRSVQTGRQPVRAPKRFAIRSVGQRIGRSRAPRRARRSRVTRQARAPTGDGDPAPGRREAAPASRDRRLSCALREGGRP